MSAIFNGNDPAPGTSRVPYRLHNIGSNRPIEVDVRNFVDWYREYYRLG